jgi:hypothetical protein
MRSWQIWLLVIVVSIILTVQVNALESTRMPGFPDSAELNPAAAIDPGYLQFEVLGIQPGIYTSKILYTPEDWEKESEAALKKSQEPESTFAGGFALAANSQAIKKYQDGPYTSGEKNLALSRCYLRSATLWSQIKTPDKQQFAEDMYDRALGYDRFNFDAWDGKISLLESQGSFLTAQELRDKKQEAMEDQARLHNSMNSLLPLPGYIVLTALFGAMLLVVIRKKDVKK